MPWKTQKQGDQWCVVKLPEMTSVKGGCHATEAEADAMVKALYANEPDAAKATVSPSVFITSEGVSVAFGKATTTTGLTTVTSTGTSTTTLTLNPQVEAAVESGGGLPWSGPIAFENQMTGDGRIFAPGAITWDEKSLPLPFRWVRADSGGHQEAVVVGRVDRIFRDEASPGVIFASGTVLDGENAPPEAAQFAALVTDGAAGGVSVDGDDAEFTIVEAADGDLEQHFSTMRLRGLTAVDIPAFIGARIAFGDTPVTAPESALVAGAAPVRPPGSWFDDPRLDRSTPLTVTADGRVYGHLAPRDVCHIAYTDKCRTPGDELMGYSNYAYFHVGELETADGSCIAVGHLTFATGHADTDPRTSARAAAAHYDNTGTVAADVRAGEDEHGIWLAGAMRPHLTDEQIREFRSAPPSGDWRRIGRHLELVAAHAVNVPGYPNIRERARVASGHLQALIVAVGQMDEDAEPPITGRRAAIVNSVRRAGLVDRIMTAAEGDAAWVEAGRPSA